jgi:hypothetical protein
MQVPEISQQDGSKAAETCQNGKMQQKKTNKQTNNDCLLMWTTSYRPPLLSSKDFASILRL